MSTHRYSKFDTKGEVLMGQYWNGSQWINQAGAPETPPETETENDAEDVTETGDENSEAENAEEETAET
jgi:hypothetical protein